MVCYGRALCLACLTQCFDCTVGADLDRSLAHVKAEGAAASILQSELNSKRPLVNAWTTFTGFPYRVCQVLAMGTLEKLHLIHRMEMIPTLQCFCENGIR